MTARKPNARPILRADSCRRTCLAGHACALSDEPHELCICVDEHARAITNNATTPSATRSGATERTDTP